MSNKLTIYNQFKKCKYGTIIEATINGVTYQITEDGLLDIITNYIQNHNANIVVLNNINDTKPGDSKTHEDY